MKSKTIEYHDKIAVDALENVRSKTVDVEDVIKKWEKLFKEVRTPTEYSWARKERILDHVYS